MVGLVRAPQRMGAGRWKHPFGLWWNDIVHGYAGRREEIPATNDRDGAGPSRSGYGRSAPGPPEAIGERRNPGGSPEASGALPSVTTWGEGWNGCPSHVPVFDFLPLKAKGVPRPRRRAPPRAEAAESILAHSVEDIPMRA